MAERYLKVYVCIRQAASATSIANSVHTITMILSI